MDFLKKLMDEFVVIEPTSEISNQRLNVFRDGLSKEKRRLLLEILDENNMIAEKMAYQNFKLGFCMGVKLAAQIFWDNSEEG